MPLVFPSQNNSSDIDVTKLCLRTPEFELLQKEFISIERKVDAILNTMFEMKEKVSEIAHKTTNHEDCLKRYGRYIDELKNSHEATLSRVRDLEEASRVTKSKAIENDKKRHMIENVILRIAVVGILLMLGVDKYFKIGIG